MTSGKWTDDQLRTRLGEAGVTGGRVFRVRSTAGDPYGPSARRRRWSWLLFVALLLIYLASLIVKIVNDADGIGLAIGQVALYGLVLPILGYQELTRITGRPPSGTTAHAWMRALLFPSESYRTVKARWLVVGPGRVLSIVAQEQRHSFDGASAVLAVRWRSDDTAVTVRPQRDGVRRVLRFEFVDGSWLGLNLRRRDRQRLLAAWPQQTDVLRPHDRGQ